MTQAHPNIIAYPASAGGVTTRVLEAGSGPDVVLFVHGVGARADRWRFTLPAMAAGGYRCIAIDLPGHGFAYKGKDFAYGVPGYVAFVESFIREQGIPGAHLVGTSLGAHILGTYACRNPGAARSFTMIGATGIFPVGPEAREGIASRMGDRSREGTIRKLKAVMFDQTLIGEDLIDEEWKINNSPGSDDSFQSLAAYFRDRLDEDIIGSWLVELGGLRKQIIWGAEDRSVPVAVGRRVEELLGLPLITIPGTAHAPYWEAPDRFNPILLDFLNGSRTGG